MRAVISVVLGVASSVLAIALGWWVGGLIIRLIDGKGRVPD